MVFVDNRFYWLDLKLKPFSADVLANSIIEKQVHHYSICGQHWLDLKLKPFSSDILTNFIIEKQVWPNYTIVSTQLYNFVHAKKSRNEPML